MYDHEGNSMEQQSTANSGDVSSMWKERAIRMLYRNSRDLYMYLELLPTWGRIDDRRCMICLVDGSTAGWHRPRHGSGRFYLHRIKTLDSTKRLKPSKSPLQSTITITTMTVGNTRTTNGNGANVSNEKPKLAELDVSQFLQRPWSY